MYSTNFVKSYVRPRTLRKNRSGASGENVGSPVRRREDVRYVPPRTSDMPLALAPSNRQSGILWLAPEDRVNRELEPSSYTLRLGILVLLHAP
jgi:hypothetical protein